MPRDVVIGISWLAHVLRYSMLFLATLFLRGAFFALALFSLEPRRRVLVLVGRGKCSLFGMGGRGGDRVCERDQGLSALVQG